MAMLEETPLFPKSYNAAGGNDDEEAASARSCGCLRLFWCGRDDRGRGGCLLQDREGGMPHQESWILAELKKLREFTEVVAGPKWKNLIRKLGKTRNRRRNDKPGLQFQYSPESYALNFAADDVEEDPNPLHSFSARFAPAFAVNDEQGRAAS